MTFRKLLTAEQRFLRRVAEVHGCWLWNGNTTPTGYGQLYVDGQTVYTHRWAYEHFAGPIPDGLTIDHLCRNRSCCNPAHLEPVTNRENNLRGYSLSARRARQTHCLRGHEFTDENTYRDARGRRYCRACKRQRQWGYRRG